jgi:hypothetical protein
MDPSELMLKKAVVAAFPLHDVDSLGAADKAVLNLCQLPSRLDVVRVRALLGRGRCSVCVTASGGMGLNGSLPYWRSSG